MPYLLDTNTVSDLVRNPQGSVAERIAQVGDQEVYTSIIVSAELRYGATKKASARLSEQLEKVLGAMDVLSLEPPADVRYGEVRTELERIGQLIGPNDLLIAAQALALDYILVTDNVQEFSRIRNLQVQNWLRR